MDVDIHGETDFIEGKDWNEEWEKNYFEPIVVDERLLIRSSFHTNYPEVKTEIIIDPKMAFGTGHHATTSMMASLLLDTPLQGKNVIDMGTGTGILALLSKKMGAEAVTGIDIDKFAIENARENEVLNNEMINWITGDHTALEGLDPADIFLANINLNIIKDGLPFYVKKIKKGGRLFVSGFLVTDRDSILETAKKNGLSFEKEKNDSGWLAMVFQKL